MGLEAGAFVGALPAIAGNAQTAMTALGREIRMASQRQMWAVLYRPGLCTASPSGMLT